MTRIEYWNGYGIRFVQHDGEWMAVLKDICDALGLKTFKVSQRLDPDMMCRVPVEVSIIPSGYIRDKNKTRSMLVINEEGIYETLYASKRLEAKQFRRWSAKVMRKMRSLAGLKQYEVMKMTSTDVQDHILDLMSTIYYDDERKMIMRSVTIAGGDVEQVPLFDEKEA